METKPFGLQAPEIIARDYGGDKMKIAHAAQMGVVDPTAAVLAGMFIDRMRNAQFQEQKPQPTIAQQVFPQGNPTQPTTPPQGVPPQGVAQQEPNSVMGFSNGGLSTLSVPDDMFNEPTDYAGGGLVAFAQGDSVPASAPAAPNFDDVLARVQQQYGNAQPGPYEQMQREALLKQTQDDPDQRRRDLYGALAKFGFGLAASKSPFFLQGVGEAASAALPDITEAAKARKAEKKQGIAGLAGAEQADKASRRDAVKAAADLYGTEGRLAGDAATIASREKISQSEIAAQTENSKRQIQAQLRVAQIQNRKTDYERFVSEQVAGAKASGDKRPDAVIAAEAGKTFLETRSSFGTTAMKEGNDIRANALKLREAAIAMGGTHSKNYRDEVKAGRGEAYKQKLLDSFLRDLGGGAGAGGSGGLPPGTQIEPIQ